jgi:hypothetical protein
MLVWAQCRSHKKRAETCRTELMFLHPVGSVGHVVRSGASGHKMSMHCFLRSGRLGVDPTKTTA